MKDLWNSLPSRRYANVEQAFKTLKVGMSKEQAIAHINLNFPKDSPAIYEEEESALAEEVLNFAEHKIYLKNGKVWFATSRDSPKAKLQVIAGANREFETKRVYLKPHKRDNMEIDENDPIFKKIRLLFITSLKEAGIEVVDDGKAADTILVLEWAASNEQFDYEVEVPVYNTTYVPGGSTTTSYYASGSGYVGRSTSYTPGRVATSYGGSKTVKRTQYYDFYKLGVTGYRNVKSEKPEYFTVTIGFSDSSRDSDYDEVVTELLGFSIPYWGANLAPVKTVKLPLAYPPVAALYKD